MLTVPGASPPLTTAVPLPSAPAHVAAPLSGWHDQVFYVRDADDNFRLYLQGRLNVDWYSPFGPGVSDVGPGYGLKSTLFLRRIRPEVSGEFLKVVQYKIEGDWGQSASDNANGQSAGSNCTVDATTGQQTCSVRTNAVEAPTQRPAAVDAFVNIAAATYLNLQVGQYKIPFTYENRTSENYTPFMESSLAVRVAGAPTTRDIGAMLWGETPDRLLYYSAGLFNGDGPNRLNADNRFDGIGRVFVHPFVHSGGPFKDFQVGVSARYGERDPRSVGYDQSSMATQGGFQFWKPTFTDSQKRLEHVIPAGAQMAVAGELVFFISLIDLTSEFVYARNNTREAVDGYQISAFTERFGALKGYAYYVEVGVWVLGDRSIVGRRGYSTPTHLDLGKPSPTRAKQAVELLAKWEQLRMKYGSASRSGTPDSAGLDGDIRVDAVALGANYWLTRHFRATVNYTFHSFPDSAPVSPSFKGGIQQNASQRAIAPAQLLGKGVNDSARDGGHTLHELMFRLGVAI